MTRIEPLNDNLVVRQHEAADKTESGLYLAEQAREKPVSATVVAPPLETPPGALKLNEGDHVLFRKYAGTEVAIDGEPLLIIAYEDLLCRLPAESAE